MDEIKKPASSRNRESAGLAYSYPILLTVYACGQWMFGQ